MKIVSIVTLGLMFLSCDFTNQKDNESEDSILGSWEQMEKRATIASGWAPLGSGSFYIVTFESNGTHSIQQGHFINSLNCTGTWVVSGNALTLTNDCGRGESQDNIHYSLSDTIMTWVYDFSETGKRFKMTTLESSF